MRDIRHVSKKAEMETSNSFEDFCLLPLPLSSDSSNVVARVYVNTNSSLAASGLLVPYCHVLIHHVHIASGNNEMNNECR